MDTKTEEEGPFVTNAFFEPAPRPGINTTLKISTQNSEAGASGYQLTIVWGPGPLLGDVRSIIANRDQTWPMLGLEIYLPPGEGDHSLDFTVPEGVLTGQHWFTVILWSVEALKNGKQPGFRSFTTIVRKQAI